MQIGIDIDNTITEVQDELNKAAYEYAVKLGKNVNNSENSLEDTKNNGDVYRKKFEFTYEELKYFLKDIQEEITNKAKPRINAVETINRLRKEGHKIFIITARDSEFHDNPYLLSKNWLDKNNIEYDKLIVNAREKGLVCKNENIDLFIDDQLNNCLDVSNEGIYTLTIGNNKEINNEIRNFDNWQQIYDFINENKIVKVIPYDDSYKNEVCNFINESMHKFIGRAYKERLDVSNINDYYIKNNGNFWLAIDVKTKKVVGTIALENRDNKCGILKRFYVDEKYQNNGVGSKLYKIFYNYIKTMTQINKIYLTCGKVLRKAHRFYESKGFIQIDNIDIDMHFAEDDDFFVKNIIH